MLPYLYVNYFSPNKSLSPFSLKAEDMVIGLRDGSRVVGAGICLNYLPELAELAGKIILLEVMTSRKYIICGP